MKQQARWNSQPLDLWRAEYADGKFIELDGHITHYREQGDGPPLILLHGWFHDSQMWNQNISALARHSRVYAIDLWGFGYSTREMLDWDYPLYVRQLEAFMDYLDIQQAVLVGHSMGAGIAIMFCTQHRERLDKLVLVSPAGLPNPSPLLDEVTLQNALKQLVLNREKSRRLLLETMFVHNGAAISDDFFRELTRFHEIKGTNEILISSLKRDFFNGLSQEIAALGKTDAPTLIVWGQHDKSATPESGIKMCQMMQNSTLHIFAESGHCANYEEPDRFNDIVTRFLTT